jgi:hypothetical protein
MSARHLPSIEALTGNDDHRLKSELRLSEVRENILLVRAALDEIDRLVPVSEDHQSSPDGHDDVELGERAALLARLGYHLVEMASALARSASSAPESSVWPVGTAPLR